MNTHTGNSHRGYVLISLLGLVIVMSALGASLYSNVASQEKMASGMRLKKRVFSAADSAVQSVWNLGELVGSGVDYSQIRRINKDSDFDTPEHDLSVSATICFDGDAASGFGGNGMDADASADVETGGFAMFTAYGDASNAASGAVSRIAMGGYLQGPGLDLPAVTPCP